jgi:hypothetical protein
MEGVTATSTIKVAGKATGNVMEICDEVTIKLTKE